MNWKLLGLAVIGGLIAKSVLSSGKEKVIYSEDSDSDNGGGEKRCEVTIKGTLRCNGPKPIKKTIIMDAEQARVFTGSRRYEAFEDFVRTYYPGYEIPARGALSASVKPYRK